MQVNIILTETYGDKKLNTTITYVNPNVSNNALKQLAIALSGLTDNSYNSVTKETKEAL